EIGQEQIAHCWIKEIRGCELYPVMRYPRASAPDHLVSVADGKTMLQIEIVGVDVESGTVGCLAPRDPIVESLELKMRGRGDVAVPARHEVATRYPFVERRSDRLPAFEQIALEGDQILVGRCP